ncbi:sugar transporter [Paracoccus aerius]|uniref:sugar transporter n=1 Tax=Paracoccus aerius TaxID=1915382 RepID=UPI00199F0395|nr:sugar transporter [Paracoccus aerius]GHG35076.1 hypothetical protein GCM10017322_37460 [Paracoccus aerius]
MSAHDQKSTSLPTTTVPAPASDAAVPPAPGQKETAEKPAAAPAPAPVSPKPLAPGKKPPAKKLNPKTQERIEAALQKPVLPPASPAQAKARHYGMAVSFVLVVILPLLVSAFYLYTRAADQYASYVGFSVRSESAAPNAAEVLGGLGSLVGASSTTDTDVLYKFIQSRDLVERVDARLNLREIWSKAPGDPIFGFRGDNSVEDLVSEWERKVRIYYDTGMIDLRILAFDPQDAQNVASAILEEGGIVINELNAIAREDALRYSRDELERAQERLRKARQAVTEFRNRYQLVDPAADVQSQIGVVTSLQQQLAEQLVSLGLLQANAQPDDPRISQTELRISIIRDQIDAERQKFASNGENVALSDVVGQYETLAVDRQFAETSYTTALASYELARAEAVRQSRYLAPYIRPTLAQEAEFPQRAQLLMMIAGFLTLLWIIGSLMFYSLRDRR